MANLLDGFQAEEDFCREHGLNKRTCARYRNEQRDGLPFMYLGGKVYIDVEGARDWIKRRIINRNATRRAA